MKTLDFNSTSKQRFADAFNNMKRELVKQDAWYHKNSDLYKNVLGKLNKTIAEMGKADLRNEDKLLTCYTELNSACDAYLLARKSKKFITSRGRNRFNQITEIQEIAAARMDAIHVSKYKQAIAENVTRFLLEKVNGVQPTRQQVAAQIERVKTDPVYVSLVQEKTVDELQTLAREPHSLKNAIKDAAMGFARDNGLWDIKNEPEKPQMQQEQPHPGL